MSIEKLLIAFLFPFSAVLVFYPVYRLARISWYYLLLNSLVLTIAFLFLTAFGELKYLTGIDFGSFAGSFAGMALLSALFYYKNTLLYKTPAKGGFSYFKADSSKLRLRDVISYAIAVEEKGKEFYSAVCELSTDENVKSLCDKLVKEELIHKKLFENMLGRWLPVPFNQQARSNLDKRLAETKVFNLSEIKSYTVDSLLEIAVNMEERSVEFYRSLEMAFPDIWKKYQLKKIQSEEEKHIIEVSSLRTRLAKP